MLRYRTLILFKWKNEGRMYVCMGCLYHNLKAQRRCKEISIDLCTKHIVCYDSMVRYFILSLEEIATFLLK